ncbi:MAG: hypothetical protein Q8Q18_01105 [bacterium]|nr:hypothetical protein [bacterium]
MLKATVSKQQQDKDRLLAGSYVSRTKEQDAQKLMTSDLIKVILGPRFRTRCGMVNWRWY